MFSVGDKILYGNSGSCVIEQLTDLRFGRTRERYYVLRPLFQNTSVIYVPADNEKLVSKMRPMLTKEQVDDMICGMLCTESAWIEDAQERKACFDELMHSNDSRGRIQLIKTLYEHKQKRLAAGKTLHVSDENYLREAQRLLCDEFAGPLEMQPSQVNDYILEKLGVA